MRTYTRTLLTTSVVLAAVMAFQAPMVSSRAAAGDNAVVQWNATALNTVLASGARATPSAAILYVAIVHAAVFDAVMAIEGSHEPYAFDGDAASGASVDAAVAAAAHDVLVHYFNSEAQKSALDAAYSASLATIPDGASETDGVSVGQRAAAAVIAHRADDGRDRVVPSPVDGDEPGEWRRTSGPADGPAVTPYVAHVTPFLVSSPEQFRPKGPNPLTSKEYAEEFERTRLYGALNSPVRSEAQTEIAKFWTENTVGQYNRALRVLANARGLSVGQSALLFATTDVPAADAMITCWNTKYHYLAWRPVTAIQQADHDGNDRTKGDPEWQPLSPTGLHPEYTSGHACLTGAITRGLREFLGTKDIDFTMTSTMGTPSTADDKTHYFATVDDLRTEVEDARVYGGDHWDTGGTDGTDLGDRLADWALKRFFERV